MAFKDSVRIRLAWSEGMLCRRFKDIAQALEQQRRQPTQLDAGIMVCGELIAPNGAVKSSWIWR